MAEISTGGKGGGGKTKKVSTKIDMTPMVDLAFLLITFFIMATTLSKPKTMEVNMPDKPKDEQEKKPPLKESNAFTILLGKGNKIYYYSGIKEPKVETTNFSGIRKVIFEKNRNPDLVIIIKFADESKYGNFVDILDEMAITGSKRYAVVDITKDDKDLMKRADDDKL